MVNPAFSESQLKNLRRQNRHLASTHRRKLVFLQASRNPAHGSGRPFFVRDVPVPASFCSAPVASAFAPPAPVSAAPQLRPFCLSPPRSDEKGLPDRISSFGNRVCRTKRRCERKEAVRTRQTTSPAGSEAGAGISCGISCAMRVPVRRPCPHPVPACIPRPHPAASSRMRAVQAL